MKTSLLFLVALLVLQTAKSAIRIVDNNDNSIQPIQDMQDTINNYASAGNIIMVQGSPNGITDLFFKTGNKTTKNK